MRLDFIHVGTIVNTHGIRGELRLLPRDGDPDFVADFDTLYIDQRPVKPTASHVHKSFVLIKLPGVDDMNAAMAYRGKEVYIRRLDAELDDGEWFDDELLGLRVLNAETGEDIGELIAVDPYPASRVYTVKGTHTYLIPAVPGAFIESIDMDANIMRVHVWEGLATDEH